MATATPPPQTKAPPDTKPFYGYLITDDKAPTPLFEAFLRALAHHIIDNVGDTNIKLLSPPKLAAFYKIAGADYDGLFVGAPNATISYIWQTTGCQHSLQPTGNDYEAPSVPALTIRGFVRWQFFQTLLCPEMHVPVLQYAAKNWNLKHPDTGVVFPPDLPRESLPLVPDPEVEKWYNMCSDNLRQEAANASRQPPPTPRSTSVPRAAPRPVFKDSNYSPPRRPRDERAERAESPRAPRAKGASPRPGMSGSHGAEANAFFFGHVPPHYAVHHPVHAAAAAAAAAGAFAATAAAATAAAKWTRRVHHSPSDDERRAGRRRSFSDYPPSPSPVQPRVRVHSPPFRAASHSIPPRRHSHPHHHLSSSSSEATDTDDDMPAMPPRGARRIPRPDIPPPVQHVRHVYPPGSAIPPDYSPGLPPLGKRESSSSGGDRRRREEPMPFAPVPRSPHRSPHRSPRRSPRPSDEPRRKSRGMSEDLRDKLSSILPTSVLSGLGGTAKPERPRLASRTQSRSSEMGPMPKRYSKESLQGSKMDRSYPYDSDDGSSNGERHRHRDRDYDRERERERGGRERERVRRDRGDPRELSSRRERERAEHEREWERERGREYERREREKEREREREAYVLRGRQDVLREKRSVDRSRDHSRNHSREPDRGCDHDDYRSRRERERDRYPLRTETLKRPIVSADAER